MSTPQTGSQTFGQRIAKFFHWLDDPEAQPARFLANRFWELDFNCRIADWYINRTHGSPFNYVFRNLRGHAQIVLTTFVLLLLVLVTGPTLRSWDIYSNETVGGLLFGTIVLSLVLPERSRFWFLTDPLTWQCLIVSAIALWICWGDGFKWWQGDSAKREMYAHWYACVAALLLVAARFGPPFLGWVLFRKFRSRFQQDPAFAGLLRQADIFEIPRRPEFPIGSIVRNLFTTPWSNGVVLVFIPAVFVLWQQDRQGLKWTFFWTVLVWGFVLAVMTLYPRLNTVLTWYKRIFFHGGPLLVSLGVILLAAIRITDQPYVTTLIEGDKATLRNIILSAYVLFWPFEYWINHGLCEHLLALFGPHGTVRTTYVAYATNPAVVETGVDPNNRCLQVHAGTRFVTVGLPLGPEWTEIRERLPKAEFPKTRFHVFWRSGSPKNFWQFYEKMDLFDRIATVARANYLKHNPDKGFHDVEAFGDHPRFDLKDLRRAILAYYVFVNALAVALLALFFGYEYSVEKPPAVVTIEKTNDGNTNLGELIFNPPQAGPARGLPGDSKSPAQPNAKPSGSDGRRKVLLVAASGGGSRAALYTSSLLHGLHRLGLDGDIQLVSGVSGGSAALGYFAAHRKTLIQDKPDGDEWRCFHQAMAYPYITDVLSGAMELRVLKGLPLAQFLAESLCREYRLRPIDYENLGDCGIGVILNATLDGEFEVNPRSGQPNPWEFRFKVDRATAYNGGSRVVFTNLVGTNLFPPMDELTAVKSEFLRFATVRSQTTKLAEAAALSANFPPFFPNAAVDSAQSRRYWVSDGGVVENRGLISLLFALKDTLEHEVQRRQKEGNNKKDDLPEIHVIVADATAVSLDYSQDHGWNAILSAAEKVSYQLAGELRRGIGDSIKALYGDSKSIHIHYLVMPTLFCSRGGIGTNWMVPDSVTLRHIDSQRSNDSLVLSKESLLHLLIDLHRDQPPDFACYATGERKNVETAWQWIGEDPFSRHAEAWQCLCKPTPGCDEPALKKP